MRRTSFRLTWSAFMSFGVFNAVVNSNYRLTGLINNGLSWKRKEEDLKKYDFTTDYMQGTVWKFFRLKTDDANK